MPRQRSKPLGVLTSITGLLGFSVLAGVLVTALVTPALAVTSMTASSSIGVFTSLPEYMEIGQQAQKNVLWGNRGGTQVPFAEVFKQNREEVRWENVSPLIKDALVAGEDRRFYEHGGVDMQSIIRAALGNLSSNEIGSGASTLAMQLVKNIRIQEAYQIPDKDERDKAMDLAQAQTLDRKLNEAKLAIGLEKRYTKNQIMLAYLNITGYGGNTYGIEAAAQQYLSKSASDVTLAEAASLIAIVQAPYERNLGDPENYPDNLERRNQILDIMLELKMVTKKQFDEAKDTPLEDYVKISDPTNGCTYASDAQTFCDYIIKKVKDLEMLGANADERQRNWDRGGYNVYTTIDLSQQDNAQAQLLAQTPNDETRFELGSSAVSTEVGTGRILIMAQNKTFNDTGEGGGPTSTAVNFSTDKAYGGSSGFPAASTWKIFTLTEWLIAGHGLGEMVDATVHEFKSFNAYCTGGWGGKYKPANDAGESGPWTVMRATARSVNVAFMSMAAQLDLCKIRDVAESMGAHRADGNPLLTLPSSVLGINEVAPLTMALAMATFAANGLFCEAVAIDKIVTADGTDLGGEKKDCHQAIPPEIAAGAAYALEGVASGGGTANPSNPGNGVPLIGKTGTDDHAWHTWVLASTTRTTLAVWVGNIIGKQSLRQISLPGGFAANARHRIALEVLTALTSSYGGEGFPSPPASALTGNSIEIPDLRGQTPEQAKSLLESLGFGYVDGGAIPSDATVGTVTSTNPSAGTNVSRGYQVTVYTSDGTLYVVMPDTIGHDPNDAKDELVAAGFSGGNVVFQWVPNTDIATATCKVTASNPGAGAGTSKQAVVTLSVSTIPDDGVTPIGPPPGCIHP